MLAPKLSPSLLRSIPVGVLALSLASVGCSRDEIAPDCFIIENDGCVIPGGTVPDVDCAVLPEGAVGATYSFNPLNGNSTNFSQWMASGLPPGLSIDPLTGLISGVPTEANAYNGIEISVQDAAKGSVFETTCGELVINPALHANAVIDQPNHCLDISTSRAELVAALGGGDGTDITCKPVNPSTSATCPLGDGNGRLAPGVSFNDTSCTHTGAVAGNRRGTWVWMVEVTQSDYSTWVPFCATNDADTFHDITHMIDAAVESDLTPGVYEYNPEVSLAFGGGTHQWAIDDPACPGADCNTFGFRFDVTCSPFDVVDPWGISLAPSGSTDTGLMHELSASGPTPNPSFDTRPWVASFEMSYCTSANAGDCETGDAEQFEQNAQTQYHYDVVGYAMQ